MQSVFVRNTYRSLWAFRCSFPSTASTSSTSLFLNKSPPLRVPICYVRSRSGQHEYKTENNSEKNEQNTEETKKTGGHEQKIKLDEATARRLRIYVLLIGSLSFGTSFFLLSRMFKEGTGLPEGASFDHVNNPGIEFNVFVQKYLKAGEVKNIIFYPQAFKAVAYLYEGAVIDGEKTKRPYVVISYTGNSQQFWADVRKEESLLGISLTNGVPITLYQGMTTWKIIELVLGILIIAYLGTQYGRLLRQRILANKKSSEVPPKL